MTEEQARRCFAQARVARLATVDAQGCPHLVPVVFALVRSEDAGQICCGDIMYSAVDAKPKRSRALRRLANIAVNPRVAVLVDHYDEDWCALWWVRVDGTARVLEVGEPEGRAALGWLIARYPQYRAQPPPGPVVAIDVTRWSSWSAAS